MPNAFSLHVICRQGSLSPKGVVMVDKNQYKSISWRFSSAHIPDLIGAPICFHEKRSERSYFGGTITDIKREEIADNDGDVRNVVFFTSDGSGRSLRWPGNPKAQIEYHVNREVPVSDLA
jgi:hypothetical protein